MQIIFKAPRRAGRTTWLVESILDHIDEKYPLRVLVVSATRPGMDSIKEKLVKRAQARCSEPIVVDNRYGVRVGDHKIWFITPTLKGGKGVQPDIIAIDDMDLFDNENLIDILVLYKSDHTLLLMTELEK